MIRKIAERISQRRKLRNVPVGDGTVIDPRAIIDMRHGGSLRIGARCTIEAGVILSPYAGSITIGDDVFIGPYCVLYGHGGLRIGDKVLIGAQSLFVPANHGVDEMKESVLGQVDSAKGIIIERGSWIGGAVQVLDGVKVGVGAVVSAGAVVTKDVDDFAIVAGVPAQLLRYRPVKQQ